MRLCDIERCKDDLVKVYRYTECSDGAKIYDGWYISKIYAIEGSLMLVYDDGSNSVADEPVAMFEWVNFTRVYNDDCSGERHAIVELLERDY